MNDKKKVIVRRWHKHLHPLRRATVKEFDKTEHEVSLDYVDKKVPYIQLICKLIAKVCKSLQTDLQLICNWFAKFNGKLTNIKYHGGGIEIYVYYLYIMELANCCMTVAKPIKMNVEIS